MSIMGSGLSTWLDHNCVSLYDKIDRIRMLAHNATVDAYTKRGPEIVVATIQEMGKSIAVLSNDELPIADRSEFATYLDKAINATDPIMQGDWLARATDLAQKVQAEQLVQCQCRRKQ